MTDYAAIEAIPADPRPGTRPFAQTALGVLGIDLLEATSTRVVMRMPAPQSRTTMSLLLVIAESVASTAAGLAVGPQRRAFGAELNASMLKPPAKGFVIATARSLAMGDDRHVWGIEIVDSVGTRVLSGRCTLGIVDVQ